MNEITTAGIQPANIDQLKQMVKTEVEAAISKVTAEIISNTKRLLTTEEAAAFLGLSRAMVYKLTTTRELSVYKPNGKRSYYIREELKQWQEQNLIRSRHRAAEEVELSKQKGGDR